MTRRTWLLAGLMAAFTAGGVWAGVAITNARSAKAADCCLDPTCPPGCSEVCPPNCPFSDCCSDPSCLPGCSEDCPPDCSDGAKAVKAESQRCEGGKCNSEKCGTKDYCPPCPLCP